MSAAVRWLLLAGLATFALAGVCGSGQLEPLPPPAAVDAARAELGRHLFHESRLSGDGSRSCASCHVPDKGYADGLALARGYNGTEHFRNAPGLLSVRLRTRLMWDGRHAGSELAAAVREMLTDAQTMNGDVQVVAERLRQIPQLFALWRRAWPEPAVLRGDHAFEAIAEYLRTLDFGVSALDRHLGGDRQALSPLAAEGLALFGGKAGCVQCHDGALLSDGRLHRLGVPEHPQILREPLRTVSLLRHQAEHDVPDAMAVRADLGAYTITQRPSDRGAFVTPGLRGLAHTGPYMHNGVFASLEEVVAFHERGGGAGSELHPLGLTAHERQALLAFLRALSAPLRPSAEPLPFDYGGVAAGTEP
ncbi:MAG: photosynthetic protein synthase I [Proteobacteria bacterium]|jgi:cytochrome c peroxidase|nr:photosynthetic protein synthase I [Pseudomonadota bacterium]